MRLSMLPCLVSHSRRICTGSRVINRQCRSRLQARQQGLHEADAPQPQLRGLSHPSCEGQASATGGTRWGSADTLCPAQCLEAHWPAGVTLLQASATSLHLGSWSFFCSAHTRHGTRSVCVGVAPTPDFLPAFLCLGPVCQMDMPVQIKAAQRF